MWIGKQKGITIQGKKAESSKGTRRPQFPFPLVRPERSEREIGWAYRSLLVPHGSPGSQETRKLLAALSIDLNIALRYCSTGGGREKHGREVVCKKTGRKCPSLFPLFSFRLRLRQT